MEKKLMKKLLHFITPLIGHDIDPFTIRDIRLDEKTNHIFVDFEVFDIEVSNKGVSKIYLEREDDNVPAIHTIEYLDSYGIECIIDGEKEDASYDAFCEAIYDYASTGSHMNNIFGMTTKEDIENIKFKNILKFFLSSDDEKYSKYGTAITIKSLTRLFLDILSDGGIKIDQKDLKNAILPKIDEMMIRYLNENPEYLDTLAIINENIAKLLKSGDKNNKKENQPIK